MYQGGNKMKNPKGIELYYQLKISYLFFRKKEKIDDLINANINGAVDKKNEYMQDCLNKTKEIENEIELSVKKGKVSIGCNIFFGICVFLSICFFITRGAYESQGNDEMKSLFESLLFTSIGLGFLSFCFYILYGGIKKKMILKKSPDIDEETLLPINYESKIEEFNNNILEIKKGFIELENKDKAIYEDIIMALDIPEHYLNDYDSKGLMYYFINRRADDLVGLIKIYENTSNDVLFDCDKGILKMDKELEKYEKPDNLLAIEKRIEEI